MPASTARSDAPTPPIEAIVVGGSAGALDVLLAALPALPADFPLPIVIVLHVSPTARSMITEILTHRCRLPAREAGDKDPVAPGVLHVAPPNYHLLIERHRAFALTIDPPVHFCRPSIDVLFASAADAYGPALAGVLLSGANEDGADGLARIHAAGGLAIIQDPAGAAAPAMPAAAIARVGPAARVVAVEALAPLLVSLAGATLPGVVP